MPPVAANEEASKPRPLPEEVKAQPRRIPLRGVRALVRLQGRDRLDERAG